MTKLTRSKERVSALGEVFTPDHIVSDMHDLLDEEKWADKTMIYLEPTCGNGQFLVQAIQKKLDAGLSPEEAANTTFGIDIMADNVEESRSRVLSVLGETPLEQRVFDIVRNNIFQANTLEYLAKGPNGEDSEWDKKMFLYEDPTGNGMVLEGSDAI